MLVEGLSTRPSLKRPKSAHIIVCGNEKGGSGKTTTAMHIAIALMKDGHSVGTIDLDGRQLSFTRYIENRKNWAQSSGVALDIPTHFHVPPASRNTICEAEDEEFRAFMVGMAGMETRYDFVVIDTPGSDTFLNRLAHRIADTLITPMNDSFIDFDLLARIDPISYEVKGVSHYALAVRDARRERRNTDQAILDWVVVRNRMSSISSRNEKKIDSCIRKLSMNLGFRIADGITERVIYREFFPIGLTALDDFEDHVLGKRPNVSHLSARQEVRQLIASLRLPVDNQGKKRAEARRNFVERGNKAITMPDIFAS